MRIITAPCSELKNIQKNIARLLAKKIDPILPDYVSGFRKGGALVLNTQPHLNKKWVINIDIENFFPSTSSKLVSYALSKLDISYNNYSNEELVDLLTLNQSLPQGSPASPSIANYIANVFVDPLVLEELNNNFGLNGFSYSRYADDLTISIDNPEFDRGKIKILLDSIIEKIESESPYKINKNKITVSHESQRQVVTGVVVNKGNSLGKKEKLRYRAIMHKVKTGQLEMTPELQGKLSFIYSINKELYHKLTKGM